MVANILKSGKQLKRIAIAIIVVELIAIVQMVRSIASFSDWSSLSLPDYLLTYSAILLAVAILFMLYAFIKPLPKNEDDVALLMQETFSKPRLLRVLLTMQIIATLYFVHSSGAWLLIDSINVLTSFSNPSNFFELIAFLALHSIAILGTAFIILLAKFSWLLNSCYLQKDIYSRAIKVNIFVAILSLVLSGLLAYQLAPLIAWMFSEQFSAISFGDLSLLISFTNIVLVILLIYLSISITLKRDQPKGLYGWIVSFIAIDLYIKIGLLTSSLNLILQHPEYFLPFLIHAIVEILLLIMLIRSSISYSRA